MKHRGGTIWLVLVLAGASPCGRAGGDVADAMRQGVAYLLSHQTPEGSWATAYTASNPGGVESLVGLAALAGGTPADDARIQKALKVVAAADTQRTYPRAVRAMLYAKLGKGYESRLEAEVAWLVKTQLPTGGWGYGPGHPQTPGNPKWSDQCNTAMALLALAQASDAGKAAPPEAWKRAAKYLQDVQQSDGGWAYSSVVRTSSFGSMTAGGVASLVAIADHLPPKERPVPTAAAANGLAWLAKNFEVAKIPKWGWLDTEYWPYFYLMFLTHTGEAAGWVVNDVDWRDPIVKHLLGSQAKQGFWTHASKTEDKFQIIRTSFAVLALSEAGAPAVVEEHILPGQPVLGGRTGALLAGLIGRHLGVAATWLRARSGEGAPVARVPLVYLQANVGATLDKDLLDRLRAHVVAGGTILVQPAPGDDALAKRIVDAFQASTADLGFETADLGDDHPLFTAVRRVGADGRPKFVGIGNAVRTPILVARGDFRSALAGGEAAALDVVENLTLLAVGEDLTGWRAAPRAAGRNARTVQSIRVARVAHAGGSAACPEALGQLSVVLSNALSVGVSATEFPLSLKAPVPQDIQLLWITGSKDPQFTPGELVNLAAFVRRGGMVFMDSTVGREAFTQAALRDLRNLFGADQVVRLDDKSDLLTGQFAGGVGAEVLPVQVSRFARRENRKFELYGVKVNARLGVVLSPLGVTSAMESDRVFGAATLATEDALRLAANVALYALSSH